MATVSIPIRRAVLMTRQAISPRLAIRIRLNMRLFTCNLAAGVQPAIWHAGTDVTIPSYRKTKQRQRLFEPKFAFLRGDFDAPRNRAAIRWSDRPVRRSS